MERIVVLLLWWFLTGILLCFVQGKPSQNGSETFRCVCDDCGDDQICQTPARCFSMAYKDEPEDEEVKYRFGCFDEGTYQMSCKIDDLARRIMVAIVCCQGELCNTNIRPQLPEKAKPPPDTSWDELKPIMVAILVPFCVLVCLVSLVCLACRHVHKRRMTMLLASERRLLDDDVLRAQQVGENTLQDLISCTSGSGGGLPRLVQQTVAKRVTLVECIGKGRYGEVWRGRYHDEDVAVKIFSSRDEASWLRETEVYNMCLLRHDNILGYYGSDMTSWHSCTQLWLLCHYHPLGSLYDFLQQRPLPLGVEALLLLAHSAAAGLAHLHTEIIGNQGKPAIAHRDVKSKNILVKSNLTCCIGDLGLAVFHKQKENFLDLGHNQKVGTKRYMAPELLAETLNPHFFDSFKCIDVYAFGLVLWEIARRTGEYAEEYKPPFYEYVPNDPSFEDMRKVVCVEQIRPVIPNRWSTDLIMNQVSKVMRECWAQNPKARLPILRVKKTLSALLKSVQLLSLPRDSLKIENLEKSSC